MANVSRNLVYKKDLERGIALQNAGQLSQARAAFLRVLKGNPNDVAALYSLAAISEQQSQLEEALRYITRACDLGHNFAQAHFAHSVILLRLGRMEDADRAIERVLKIDPKFPGARNQKAKLLSLGTSKSNNHELNAADSHLNPEIELIVQRALALQGDNKTNEAVAAFETILKLDSCNFVALYSLGAIYSQSGEPRAALDYLDQAARINPSAPIVHHALGTVKQALGLYEESLKSFDKAIQLQPNYREALVNKCSLLHSMRRQSEAVAVMNSALEVLPNDPGLLNNMGYLLTEFKQNSQAARFFKRLVDIDPYYENAQGLLAYARLHACDWTDHEKLRASILSGIGDGEKVCSPMALMALTDDPALHYKCAVNFGRSRFPTSASPLWSGERYRHRRRRIAFLSADFREHPVGYLLIELIEKLASLGYETIGLYSGHNDSSTLYNRYRTAFTHYLACDDKSGIEIARVLRAFEVDVAIDLAGYTSGSRLDVLAYRPCPVQATFLGFPGTLGLNFVDYLIADHYVISDQAEKHYTEKVLKLPHSYLPRDSSVITSSVTPRREDYGLPSNGAVFCSFNHDYKINPPLFDVWMKLLRTNENSVLWLMQLNDDAHTNLQKEAALRDVNPTRLVFATRLTKIEDHLARYRLVDLFLDTFPYGGHTTASDALLMGTPVVTMAGRSFASRVAGCMLHDTGKFNNIAEDFDEYYSIAQSIIENPNAKRVEQLSTASSVFLENFSELLEKMT
jgi:predicted O-linked N-acetylglucosamine transferase (SPINDLY family)